MSEPRGEQWIVIPNWERFQHYKDRNPKWIKVYTDLLDNPRFRGLTGTQKGLLFDLWLLYASSGQEVPASASYLARRLGGISEWEHRRLSHMSEDDARREGGESLVRVRRERGEWVLRGRDLKALEKAKFIEISASKPIAKRYTREEVLRTSSKRAGRRANANGAAPAQKDRADRRSELLTHADETAANWTSGDSAEFDEKLDWLEVEHNARLTHLERDSLWVKAFTER